MNTFRLKKKLKVSGVLIAGFMSSFLYAAPQLTAESQQLLQQLSEQIKGTLIAIGQNEVKAGKRAEDVYIALDFPAQKEAKLGLVLDLESANSGYRVLSTTPGGFAEQISIEAGDVITHVNDTQVSGTNSQQLLEEIQMLTPGERIKLAVNRDGQIHDFDAQLTGRYIPEIKLEVGSQLLSYNGLDSNDADAAGNENEVDKENVDKQCGRVSVFFRPPETRDLYPARINKIDDDSVLLGRVTIRLPPGKHVVKLNERITDRHLRRKKGIRKAKPLEIDVKPNTNYYLAAKFIRSKRMKMFKEEYWEPVVWKSSQRKCELD
ncbi:MAG: PDZ domain-containing protein [Kangiellaceae bacterium]|nr:PDZ domain-containing protein [Kangiellaceae bacterium]MCW8997227.1 PDZ domain-containing protein [Kangiellaceae bacterium]